MNTKITVKVVKRFGDVEPIGSMQIRADALPATPDYCFAIGYQPLSSEGEHRLLEICLQSDEAYAAFLAKQQKGPAVPADPTPKTEPAQIPERAMLRYISALPEPDLFCESKISDPVGSDAFYSARTVVALLLRQHATVVALLLRQHATVTHNG